MASLDKKIEAYMGRSVDFLTEVTLQDDGKGAYIAEWNIKDKAKPTDDQLKAVESDADKLEKNAKAIEWIILELLSTTEKEPKLVRIKV